MNQDNSDHPTLLIVRGRHGSGKTYLASKLRQAIGADKIVMLDPDAINRDSREYIEHVQSLNTEGVDPAIYPFRFLKAQAFEGILAHKVILWNQPFTNLGMFNRLVASLQAYAADHGTELAVLVVEVDADPTIAKERVMQRVREGGHGPSEATLNQRIDEYKSVADEGYDVVTVQGEGDVNASVATVLQALLRLL